MNAVRTIKDDLLERRLWPVALVLVAALIAVPLLLSGGGNSDEADAPAPPAPVVDLPAALRGGAPGAPTPGSTRSDGTLQLTATAGSLGDARTRKLRDPFRPQGGGDDEQTTSAADEAGPAQPGDSGTTTLAGLDGDSSTTVNEDLTASVAGGGADTTGGGDSGAGGGTSGGTGGGGTGGGTGGGSQGPSGGSGNGNGGGSSPSPTPPAPTTLEYPIDVRFGAVGAPETRAGLDPLRALPSEDNPVVVYLGASDDRSEATFLVSAELQVTGEGTCRPERATCTTLVLKAGETAVLEGLDPDGKPVQYELELRRILPTPVRIASGSSASLALLTAPAEDPAER